MADFDRRLTPARPDLAAEILRGRIDAPRYARFLPHTVRVAETGLWPSPDVAGPFDTQLLLGEGFGVLEVADGWAWGQSVLDGYVGYLPADTLTPADGLPADRAVATLAAQLYPAPGLKQPPEGRLPFGARVTVTDRDDRAEGYSRITTGEWIATRHLRPLDDPAPDWVAVAEMFLGVPYVWGGRSSFGLDCSALIQLARQAAGHDCVRDSDMQARELGRDLDPDAPLSRGDLIFWRGHVGLMRDGETLLHANAHHMAVASEPLSEAVERIGAREFGKVTRRARLDAAFIRH